MPDYRLPLLGLLRFSLPFLLRRRRSFARDGQTVMAANAHPQRIEGRENVPRSGSFILVMNHYNRPGLRPQICGFIISTTIAQLRQEEPEIAWVFAGELERFIYAPLPVPGWLMRWMFRRLAEMYGLVAMPRHWRRPIERAVALRRLLKILETRPIGLTPEAAGPGVLQKPPPGTGLLLSRLAKPGYPLLPVGIYEEDDGTLVIRFGPPFHLEEVEGAAEEERDRRSSDVVMAAIGRLLPPRWQGVYREKIEAAGPPATNERP